VVSEPLASSGGKLVVLSSRMGSIGNAADSAWWLYRASKAALNSVLKSASIELGARGVVCMALHPGWVQTDMGGANATLRVEESVSSMRNVIAAANRSHNGRFLNYNGEQLEW
jgi:NAD(P)-dependent dehydrogenase (short-subunit alcohol dehydrogenase family)